MSDDVETDVVFHSCKAAIWPFKSGESVKNMREELKVSHRIKIRFFPGITSQMRINFGTRVFEIVSIINPDEANKVLEMVCNEWI